MVSFYKYYEWLPFIMSTFVFTNLFAKVPVYDHLSADEMLVPPHLQKVARSEARVSYNRATLQQLLRMHNLVQEKLSLVEPCQQWGLNLDPPFKKWPVSSLSIYSPVPGLFLCLLSSVMWGEILGSHTDRGCLRVRLLLRPVVSKVCVSAWEEHSKHSK